MARTRLAVSGGALAFAAAMLVFACTDTSGLTGDDADASPDAPGETAPTDTAPPPPPPSTDGGADADAEAPNLLSNGDFELGCAGWGTAFQAVASEDPLAHGGTRSCKVCNTTDNAGDLSQHVTGLVPGARYLAEAWIHSPTNDASAPSAKVEVGITVLDAANAFLFAAPRNTIQMSPTWTRDTSLVDVPDGGATAIVLIQLDSAPFDACFLVDDARFTRVQ